MLNVAPDRGFPLAAPPGYAHFLTPSPRRRVLDLIKLHGWNATSFQVLEPGFSYWFDGVEGAVAYVDTGAAWVAAGAPLAPPHRLEEVAQRFVAAAKLVGRRACFFGTEHRFARCAGLDTLSIGEQAVWDPQLWPSILDQVRSLREQLRRGRAAGVTIRRLTPAELAQQDAPLRRPAEWLIQRWLAAHPLPPLGFLVDVQPFSFPEERRYFLAERAGEVVGLLVAVPVYQRNGWLFEDLLRDPSAPNGTAELLIDRGMRSVAAEGGSYVTLGLAPLAGPVALWLQMVRAWSARLYDFRGLRAFRAKLRPQRWDPIFLSYPIGSLGALAAGRALYDVLRAFAGASLLRFGVRSLRGGRGKVGALK